MRQDPISGPAGVIPPARTRVRTNVTRLALTVTCAQLVACAAPMTVGESFRQYALDRAAFEMQCPKQNVEMVQLNRPLTDPAYAGSQVGARGCGKQAVYVLSYGAGWVLNSESSPQEKSPQK